MRMRTLLSAAICAATISALGVARARADEPAPSGDLAKLQGDWTATFGPQNNIVVVLTVKGNSALLAFSRDGQSIESMGEIKIDEKAKPHKTLDWVKFTTQTGDTAPVNLGIYRLSGDAITICNGGPGNERPTEFKAGEAGQPPQLFVLNRKTPASEAATTAGGDLAKMQGRWTAKVGPNKNATLTIMIKGTSVHFVIPTADGTPREPKGEVKINETAKPHKTVDWVNVVGANGQAAPPILGIYKLQGDTLTICSGGVGGDRPTEFKAGEGNKPSLLVLSRD